MRRSAVLTGLLVALSAASAALAVPASAAAEPLAQPVTLLEVSGPGGIVYLTCDPPGGSHPNAETACAEIEAANGLIENIPAQPDATCSTEYEPSVINVIGIWQDHPVQFQEIATNAGCARISHGSLFDFSPPEEIVPLP